jgi:Arm DNA-binding domain
MALTDLEIRSAKPTYRLVKLSDGGGLQLWITPDGAKRWRLAYRSDGAQKLLAIGVYPATGLREARDAREEAKRLLAAGQDPSLAKRLAKATKAAASANTFDAVASELLDKKRREAKARTLDKLEWLLGLARAAIGARPVTEITARNLGHSPERRNTRAARNRAAAPRDHRRGFPLRGRDRARRRRSYRRIEGRIDHSHRFSTARRSSSLRRSGRFSARSKAMRARRKHVRRSNCSP